MSRTSKTLRRLSVPVLVSSVIMTGVSSLGFAGVAYAAPSNGAGGGAIALTADNTGTAAANDPYATIQNDPQGNDTITVTATYKQGAQSTGANTGQAITFSIPSSSHATFTNGTKTATCTTSAGDLGTCTVDVVDPASEAVVVTARPTPNTAGNDTTVGASTITLHYAGLHWDDCSSVGYNSTNNPPTAPDNFCYTQQTAGQPVTQTLTYLQDGAPKAGVSVEIDINNGVGAPAAFAANQPGYYAIDEVDCTTNAQGKCSVTYTANGENTTTYFDAYTTANTTPYPDSEAEQQVDFVHSAVPGRIVDTGSQVLAPPSQNSSAARPGDAIQKTFTLYSTCTLVAPATNCDITPGNSNTVPLANRSVTLTVDHGFFTPNCTPDGSLNGPSYAQCSFSPAPTAGSQVGNLQSLGNHITVTTDASGNFGATIGIAKDAGFDDDGIVNVTITGVATGSTSTFTADNGGSSTTTTQSCSVNANAAGCPKLTKWSTINRPLNPGTITFVAVDGHDISADPNNVPTTQNRVYVAHLTDQFGNLTSGLTTNFPPRPVTIHKTGVGSVDSCTDWTSANPCTGLNGNTGDFGVFGSYTGDTDGNGNPGQERIISSSSTPGLQTVTGTWNATTSLFQSYTPASNGTPAVVVYDSSGTVQKTATVKFNFYDQTAQPVVTFATTPSNTVSAGTVVTVSATVKDQFGFPISGYPVSFLLNGTNQSSCNPLSGNQTTGPDGRAGFTFGCNTPGTASVTIVVSDTHGNEIARGVQNVTFTNGAPPSNSGDPAFTINVGTIRVGQCATLRNTSTGAEDVLVKGAHAAGFTKIKTLPAGGAMAICPSTNSVYQTSNSNKLSSQKTLLVKAIQTLVVKRDGQSAAFTGHVIPGVVGRSVIVFFYVDGGHVEYGGLGKVTAGGNFNFSGKVNHPGRVVHFFAQTYADDFNTSGRSPLVNVQY